MRARAMGHAPKKRARTMGVAGRHAAFAHGAAQCSCGSRAWGGQPWRAHRQPSVAHTPWPRNMFYLAITGCTGCRRARRDVHDLRATGQQHDAQPGLEASNITACWRSPRTCGS